MENQEKVELQNRKYKGKIKDGYIYYEYSKKVKMKDGTFKQYKNTIRRKRSNKLNKRGKDKKKRAKGSGRPMKIKNKIQKLLMNVDEAKHKEIYDHIFQNFFSDPIKKSIEK